MPASGVSSVASGADYTSPWNLCADNSFFCLATRRQCSLGYSTKADNFKGTPLRSRRWRGLGRHESRQHQASEDRFVSPVIHCVIVLASGLQARCLFLAERLDEEVAKLHVLALRDLFFGFVALEHTWWSERRLDELCGAQDWKV